MVMKKNSNEDDDDEDDLSSAASTSSPGNESWLPKLNQGDSIYVAECSPSRHETAPPPRFSEGTLVKSLEEALVDRRRTSVLRALVARGYVAAKNGAQLCSRFQRDSRLCVFSFVLLQVRGIRFHGDDGRYLRRCCQRTEAIHGLTDGFLTPFKSEK